MTDSFTTLKFPKETYYYPILDYSLPVYFLLGYKDGKYCVHNMSKLLLLDYRDVNDEVITEYLTGEQMEVLQQTHTTIPNKSAQNYIGVMFKATDIILANARWLYALDVVIKQERPVKFFARDNIRYLAEAETTNYNQTYGWYKLGTVPLDLWYEAPDENAFLQTTVATENEAKAYLFDRWDQLHEVNHSSDESS